MSVKDILENTRQFATISDESFIVVLTYNYVKKTAPAKYEVSIMRASTGDMLTLCRIKDWDAAKEQTRFYADWFKCPFQYALLGENDPDFKQLFEGK